MKKTSIYNIIVITTIVLITSFACTKSTPVQDTHNDSFFSYPSWVEDITELTTDNISCSGFTVKFDTLSKCETRIEWVVYPSDIFYIDKCPNDGNYTHWYTVSKYPEGGTVFYRFYKIYSDNVTNYDNLPRTRWRRVDLPRCSNNTVFIPPYAPIEKELP